MMTDRGVYASCIAIVETHTCANMRLTNTITHI